MSDLEQKLLDSATTEEEKEAIRKILEHERRVNHAKSIELFLQGLGGVHNALTNEVRKLSKQLHIDASLLVIKVCTTILILFGLYLLTKLIFQ